MLRILQTGLVLILTAAAAEPPWSAARANGARAEEMFARSRRMLHAWLAYADRETLLLPDRLPGVQRGREEPIYTPHNSGADNYPYLIITSYFTDPALYRGRMLDMLRNEIRYTNVEGGSIPGNLDFRTRKLGPPSFFGAGEYAKDGLVSVTELLGRTPWYYRMADLMSDFLRRAERPLPARGAELNGDVLQALARLIPMTGDAQFLRWAEEIGDVYIHTILPKNHYLPGYEWDFAKAADIGHTRLRDHGNEILVGLVLIHALETELGRPRARTWEPVIRRMLDRVLASANPHGMLYNSIRNADLAPQDRRLSDNWGYVYAAIYAFYQTTGDEKYREAVRRVLRNLPHYRNYDWETGGMDGYADSIEGALYLVNREPAPEALDWIETEMNVLLARQQPDGAIERWYGDGNFNRTLLLYAMMKTQGCSLGGWQPGVELGAARQGDRLYVTVHSPHDWSGTLRFDYARHRRELNLRKNYARLNEWPEWYTVDENRIYRVVDADGKEPELRLGSEMKLGLPVALRAGQTRRLVIEP